MANDVSHSNDNTRINAIAKIHLKVTIFVQQYTDTSAHYDDSLRNVGTQWLRHCATNRKVAGSIPDGVGFFSLT
jgi:hypothetical protein